MKAQLLLLLLVIPVIAYAASWGLQAKLDSDLRAALASNPELQARDLSMLTMDKFCSLLSGPGATTLDPSARKDIGETCDFLSNLHIMQTTAVVAVVIAIVLMVVVALAGRLARGRRVLLLLAFAPLLHLTMVTLSILMVLHAALGMATLWYGESALIGRVHVGIMLALGLGAVFGVLILLRAQFQAVRKATSVVIGKRLDRNKQQNLWAFVRGLAKVMGAAPPDAILIGLEPNFYVTEADIVYPDGKLTGRTMYVSAPLCRLLTPDEFKSVLAHELAHYKGRDTRFSQRFYPIYRGATEGLAGIAQGLSRGDKGSASDFVLLPAFFMLSYFLGCFSKAENEISRDRELAADAEAARIGDARTIATALVKVHAYADAWPFVREQMKKALTQGQQLINPSLLFATMVADVAKEHDPLATLGEEGPPHPTDTHPPLSQRLKALNVPMKDIRAAALALPENPSLTLIDNPEALEKDLSDIEHAIMLHRGEAQLPSPPEEETPPATQP